MADPWSGPNRFGREPFDRGYYLTKYGGRTAVGVRAPEEPKPEPEPPKPLVLKPSILAELQLSGEVRELERQNRQLDYDILELEAYIDQLTAAWEEGLAAQLAEQEAERQRQLALLTQLEENVTAAREALIWAWNKRRQQQNNMAVIQAVIREYF